MQVSLSGEPIKEGQTVTLDNTAQIFSVIIRSMSGVDEDTLKQLIQQKYEVIMCEKLDQTDYVWVDGVKAVCVAV